MQQMVEYMLVCKEERKSTTVFVIVYSKVNQHMHTQPL